jgi:hypothetical protein
MSPKIRWYFTMQLSDWLANKVLIFRRSYLDDISWIGPQVTLHRKWVLQHPWGMMQNCSRSWSYKPSGCIEKNLTWSTIKIFCWIYTLHNIWSIAFHGNARGKNATQSISLERQLCVGTNKTSLEADYTPLPIQLDAG